jgi:hypothetical protein
MGTVKKETKKKQERRDNEKDETNQGEWAIHYIFKKLWKKREKKLRWTTLALHP